MTPPPGLVRIAVPLACGLAIGWAIGQWQAPAVSAPAGTARTTPELSRKLSVLKHSPADAAGEDEFQPLDASAGGVAIEPANLMQALRSALRLTDYTDVTIRLREIVRTLSPEQIPAVLEEIRQLPRKERWRIMGAVGSHWAETDLQGALKFCEANRGDNRYGELLNAVVNKWALTEPSEAIVWVKGLPSGQQQQLLVSLTNALSRSNPQAALDLINSPGTEQRYPYLAENLFSEWYLRDPSAAVAAFSQLKGNLSSSAVQGLAQVMANDDPAAAAAWATALPDMTTRNTALIHVAHQWSEDDPEAALNWAQGLQDKDLRNRSMWAAIRSLAGRNLPAARAALDALPAGPDKDTAVIAAADALRTDDNMAALQLLSALPDSPNRTAAVSRTCAAWAAVEPQAALDWMFENNAARAGDSTIAEALAGWSQRSPDQANAWLNRIADPEKRDIARSSMAAGLVTSDPARAKELFSTLSAEHQSSIAIRMTHALANQDLDATRSWAETLPPGRAQNSAFVIVASQMASKDPEGTAQWIERLPAGTGRDKAISGFADQVIHKDPEAALEWALTISDQIERSRKLDDLSARWNRFDSSKARKWIQANSNLTPAERQRLLER